MHKFWYGEGRSPNFTKFSHFVASYGFGIWGTRSPLSVPGEEENCPFSGALVAKNGRFPDDGEPDPILKEFCRKNKVLGRKRISLTPYFPV